MKLEVSALQLKTRTRLFSSEFRENCKWLGGAGFKCLLSSNTLPYQFTRVICRRFHKEYISTSSVITKEFLKALIKSSY